MACDGPVVAWLVYVIDCDSLVGFFPGCITHCGDPVVVWLANIIHCGGSVIA